MTGRLDFISPRACTGCDKYAYTCRKAARKALQRMNYSRKRMSAYECRHNPGAWHIGHTPTAVRRGQITRDQITDRRESA